MGGPSDRRSEERRRYDRARIIASLGLQGNDVERMSLSTLRLLESFATRLKALEDRDHGQTETTAD